MKMKKKCDDLRVGVIGAGPRSGSYLQNIPAAMLPRVRLTAIADPNPRAREVFIQGRARGATPQEYEDGAQLLAQETCDALIIGSPNHTHVDFTLEACKRRIPLLLEKPVAIDVEGCCRLWRGWTEAGKPPVVVGFVLRYTPFYTRVRELLDQRALGELLALDADESVSAGTSALYARGWRMWDKYSGGFMVEKCCHDFDVFNWLTNAHVCRAFSIGKRTHFVPRPASERQAHVAPDLIARGPVDYGSTDPLSLSYWAGGAPSIYDAPGDIPDHQVVMLEWDNGILSSFSASIGQARNTRRLRICGSAGMLEGDIERSKLSLDIAGAEKSGAYTTREIPIAHDESGHHGGDSIINEAFWSLADGRPATIRAGIREGIEAALVGIAAELSEQTGQVVDVRAMRAKVFGSDL